MTEAKGRPVHTKNGKGRSTAEGAGIMALYLSDVSATPLLSAEEELELAAAAREGREAEERLRANGNLPPDGWRTLEQEVTAGHGARDDLVKANLRLVMSIAGRYVGRGVPFADLVQEGTIGLISAIDRFDDRLGYRLSTYATWWIRQAVSRAVAKQARNIRLPMDRFEDVGKLRRASLKLEQRFGREPTSKDLAEEMAVSVDEVENLFRWAQPTVSLDAPITSDEEDGFLLDFIEDEEATDPESSAAHSLVQEQLEEMLSTLTPRHARIIRLRFGLEDGRSYSLRQIAERLGITRERVRQIVTRTLEWLRHRAYAVELGDF